MKTSFITGSTGQDGSYLIRKLLDEGRRVCALVRRASTPNTSRIDDLQPGIQPNGSELIYCTGDLTDTSSLMAILEKFEPDELYNLAAQSDVRVSFDVPEYTAEVNALGALRLLEAIRQLGLASKTRFYQASTSRNFWRRQRKAAARNRLSLQEPIRYRKTLRLLGDGKLSRSIRYLCLQRFFSITKVLCRREFCY